ncbi:MAG: hypothetical protein LBV46_03640 [Bacteroidales bacterium]|jgi:hypothetical protein|nr:hypothetical protein [Bacteroidales bacterium]
MKKIIIVFLGCLIFLASACRSKKDEIVIVPDVQKNHLERNHIKGNVNIILTKQYLQQDSAALKLVSIVQQEYSLDGYLKRITSFSETYDTLLIRLIRYDDLAHETSWIEYVPHGDTIARCIYEYDENHFKSAEKYYQHDSLTLILNFKTDGEGNPIAMTRKNGEFLLTNKMYYNELGLINRIEEYDPNGKIFKYFTIDYDNFGDEVNRRAFKSANNLIEYTYTRYDRDGRLLKVIYEDQLHNNRETSEYSQHDARLNWLKEIRTVAVGVQYVRERKITYFDSH